MSKPFPLWFNGEHTTVHQWNHSIANPVWFEFEPIFQGVGILNYVGETVLTSNVGIVTIVTDV